MGHLTPAFLGVESTFSVETSGDQGSHSTSEPGLERKAWLACDSRPILVTLAALVERMGPP